MSFSLMTLISSIFMGCFIVSIQFICLSFLCKDKIVDPRLLSIMNFLFIFRMILPIEFGHTITITSTKFLPLIRRIMDESLFSIDEMNIKFQNLLIFFWVIFAIRNLLKMFIEYNHLQNLIASKNTAYNISSYFDSKQYPVKITNIVDSPAVIGIKNPTILLPKFSLNEKEINYILKHELIHISKFDLVVKFFYEILLAIHWWNPIMYLFRKQMNQVVELRTDDLLIQQLSEKEKIEYSHVLIKIKQQQTSSKLTNLVIPLLYTNQNLLLQRVKNILEEKKFKFNSRVILLIIAISFFSTTSLVFEPYFIRKDDVGESFTITPENSFFIRNEEDESLDLYVDNNYITNISSQEIINELFDNIPIKN